MKNKKKFFLNIILILLILFAIVFLPKVFKNYNLERSISACILVHKQTSKNFDLNTAKEFCKKDITKRINK